MKANDLRIGNLVYAGTDEYDRPFSCKVSAIDRMSIHWDGNRTVLQYVKPIPITPEWLEKVGGNIEIKHYRIKIDDHAYLLWIPDRKCFQLCFSGVYFTESPGEFVHQLQNLYFALTGQELNVDN